MWHTKYCSRPRARARALQTPVSLGLRIWDIFLLDGDRMLPAMAYTVMKLHKRYLMPMESLDEFCNYLQIKLEKDFCFDDDTVISAMERNMEELKRAKLDYPGSPLAHELPRYPFGTFKEPSFISKVLRNALFSRIASLICCCFLFINEVQYCTWNLFAMCVSSVKYVQRNVFEGKVVCKLHLMFFS